MSDEPEIPIANQDGKDAVDFRPVPSLEHQLVCLLAERFPEAMAAIARAAGVRVPRGLRPVAKPTDYTLDDGSTVHGDVSLDFLDDGDEVRYFIALEVQLRHEWAKHFALRAYHAARMRRTGARGHVLVLSPGEAAARKFRREEARLRRKLAFAATFVSRAGLEEFAAPDQPLAYRAIAAALTDFTAGGVPAEVYGVAAELAAAGEEEAANLMAKVILDRSRDKELGAGMSAELAERMMTVPVFREVVEARVEARVAAREAAAREETAREIAARETAAREEAAREIAARETAAREEAAREIAARETAAAATLRETMLTIFSARGDTPSRDGRAVLAACGDMETLLGWVRRAAGGESSEQILR